MAWQATVVAQVASHTAGHLRRFYLQDLAACAIYVHGDDLQVRGQLLGKLTCSSGLGGMYAGLEGLSRLLAAVLFSTFFTKVTYVEKVSGGSCTLRISRRSSGLSFSKKV